MSALSPIARQRLDRAGDEVLAVHLAVEEEVEQRPDPLRRDRLAAAVAQRAGEARRCRGRNASPCASATHSAKCGAKCAAARRRNR